MPDYKFELTQKTKEQRYFPHLEKTLKDKKVIIIGAGISGLSAALEAVNMGAEVTILEAREHPGGRIYTSEIITSTPINMGANWIHLPQFNPIYELAQKLGLPVKYDDLTNSFLMPENKQTFLCVTYDNIYSYAKQTLGFEEIHVSRLANFTALFVEHIGEFIENAGLYQLKYPKKSYNAEAFLNKSIEDGTLPKPTTDEKAYVHALPHPSEGSELKDLSILGAIEEAPKQMLELIPELKYLYHNYGGHDVILPDYSHLIDYIKNTLQERSVNIEYKAIVTNINYETSNNNIITCQDGRTFTADFVISTLPVKCLKKPDLFTPKLPENLQLAAENIHMGKWEKLILEYNQDQLSPEEKEKINETIFCSPMQFIYDQSHYNASIIRPSQLYTAYKDNKIIFTFIIAADQAVKLSEIIKAKGIDQAKTLLTNACLNTLNIWTNSAKKRSSDQTNYPKPHKVDISDWASSPYSQGSWSALGTLGSPISRMAFHENPYDKHLFFAGEHTNIMHPGTTHGGLDSGQDAVLRICDKKFEYQQDKLWGSHLTYQATAEFTENFDNTLITFEQDLTINTDNISFFASNAKHEFSKHHNIIISIPSGTYLYRRNGNDTLSLLNSETKKPIIETQFFSAPQGYGDNIYYEWALPVKYFPDAGIKTYTTLTFNREKKTSFLSDHVSYNRKAILSLEVRPMRGLDYLISKK